MTIPLLPALTVERLERACAESAPEILFSHSRKRCSTCMKNKTYWVVVLDPENKESRSLIPGLGLGVVKGPFSKRRYCWECMTARIREAISEGF